MEGSVVPGSGPAETAEPPRMGFVSRLIGIYTEPRKTFEDIERHGSWLPLFLVVLVLAMASVYILTTRMDHETYMRKSLEMSPIKLSEEQIQQALQRPQGPVQRYMQYVMIPIGMLVVYAVCTGVFLLIFVLMGASLKFKKSFAFTIWGMAPPGLIVGLLGILFMYVKDPADLNLDPTANVASNLGLLFPRSQQPVLHSLAASIDLFSFWTIFLLALGFSVASKGKLTMGKAAVGVIIPWAIYVLGKAGFAAIFS